jgi:nicotinamidase-related amidase
MTAHATADWTADHHQTQIVKGLLATNDLIVPRHHGFSATLNTELLKILRGNGIENIIFAGVSLNVAIPISVAHAAEEGFHVVVVREAVVGTPAEYGAHVLDYTISMLASVISLHDLERRWAGTTHVPVNG